MMYDITAIIRIWLQYIFFKFLSSPRSYFPLHSIFTLLNKSFLLQLFNTRIMAWTLSAWDNLHEFKELYGFMRWLSKKSDVAPGNLCWVISTFFSFDKNIVWIMFGILIGPSFMIKQQILLEQHELRLWMH